MQQHSPFRGRSPEPLVQCPHLWRYIVSGAHKGDCSRGQAAPRASCPRAAILTAALTRPAASAATSAPATPAASAAVPAVPAGMCLALVCGSLLAAVPAAAGTCPHPTAPTRLPPLLLPLVLSLHLAPALLLQLPPLLRVLRACRPCSRCLHPRRMLLRIRRRRHRGRSLRRTARPRRHHLLRRQALGRPKVDELQMAVLGQQQVLWLEIPVHHPLAPQVL